MTHATDAGVRTAFRRRSSVIAGTVLVFGADAGDLVSELRQRGFEVISARREEEVVAIAEAVPLDAVVVEDADLQHAYSVLLTITMAQPDCQRVLLSSGPTPDSIAEFVDLSLARPCDMLDLTWALMS